MFIFIATNTVRPGRLPDERRRAPVWAEFIDRNEPRLVAFHEFLSEDATEVEYVQVHPDAQSFEDHLDVLHNAELTYQDTLEATTAIRIYGKPTARILSALRQSVGPDVPITVLPTHLAGFTRPSA
jgi:hypothetical protein